MTNSQIVIATMLKILLFPFVVITKWKQLLNYSDCLDNILSLTDIIRFLFEIQYWLGWRNLTKQGLQLSVKWRLRFGITANAENMIFNIVAVMFSPLVHSNCYDIFMKCRPVFLLTPQLTRSYRACTIFNFKMRQSIPSHPI